MPYSASEAGICAPAPSSRASEANGSSGAGTGGVCADAPPVEAGDGDGCGMG